MTHWTASDLQVLHGVRVLGFAEAHRVADRVGLDLDVVSAELLDAQARGDVSWSSFAGVGGWSLTEAGREHGEQRLAVELDAAGARPDVTAAYDDFLPLNDLVARACTAWQLAELGVGGEPVSLSSVLERLHLAADELMILEERLVRYLTRFAGYHARFATAVESAAADPGWITGTDRDSCHTVWFQLHEDLIATLGLRR